MKAIAWAIVLSTLILEHTYRTVHLKEKPITNDELFVGAFFLFGFILTTVFG